jgi:phage tail-like protein
MTDSYYPPSGFYFTVAVVGSGSALAALTDIDSSFLEVSGIEARFETEAVQEGGENRFVHQLPKNAKYANLVLKRGIVAIDSFLGEWVGQSVGSGLALPILPQNLLVTLLDANKLPLVAWGFVNAYPVRVQVAPLNSMDDKVLIESLELSYNYFDRINLGGAASIAVKLAQFVARMTGR